MTATCFKSYTNHGANHQVVADYENVLSEHDCLTAALVSLRANEAKDTYEVVSLVPPLRAIGGQI